MVFTSQIKEGKSTYRTAQPFTLAAFLPWGIQQELVVGDLPGAKVVKAL